MQTTYYIRLEGHQIAIADLSYDDIHHGYQLHRVNVPKEFRRQGIGTQLLKEILEDADREGVSLHLWIHSSGDMTDEELASWYRKHGFMHLELGAMRRYPKVNMYRELYKDRRCA